MLPRSLPARNTDIFILARRKFTCKVKCSMIFRPAILPLAIHTKDPQAETEADTYIQRFISAFFTISQKMEATKHLRIIICISKCGFHIQCSYI